MTKIDLRQKSNIRNIKTTVMYKLLIVSLKITQKFNSTIFVALKNINTELYGFLTLIHWYTYNDLDMNNGR